jgi:hypothetical protein
MYLAVGASVHFISQSLTFSGVITARLLHISFARLLHSCFGKANCIPIDEFHLARKRCHRRVRAFIWTFCLSQGTCGVRR